jgi:DNA (cytosine-5)-methyltransferase 1
LLKKNGIVESPDRHPFKSGKYSKPKSKYQKFMRGQVRRKSADSHSFANHRAEIITRFEKIHKNHTPNKNLSKKLRKDLGIRKHTIILLASNSPAPTMTTLPDDYIHYKESRILTVREIARIQSFPDWFEFRGKYTTGGPERIKDVPRYTQVGNAIPPLFGELSGITLKNLL